MLRIIMVVLLTTALYAEEKLPQPLITTDSGLHNTSGNNVLVVKSEKELEAERKRAEKIAKEEAKLQKKAVEYHKKQQTELWRSQQITATFRIAGKAGAGRGSGGGVGFVDCVWLWKDGDTYRWITKDGTQHSIAADEVDNVTGEVMTENPVIAERVHVMYCNGGYCKTSETVDRGPLFRTLK